MILCGCAGFCNRGSGSCCCEPCGECLSKLVTYANDSGVEFDALVYIVTLSVGSGGSSLVIPTMSDCGREGEIGDCGEDGEE